jgi:hypothetical protein
MSKIFAMFILANDRPGQNQNTTMLSDDLFKESLLVLGR